MALSFNWVGAVADPGGSPSSLTVEVASGKAISAGDLLMVWINDDGASELAVAPPSGWTAMPGQPPGNTPAGNWTYGFYKIAAAADVGATGYTFDASPSFSTPTAALVDIGGASGTQFDFTQAQSTSGSSITFSSETSTAADLIVIFAGGYYNNTFAFPSGWTAQVNFASGSGDWALASIQQAAAGSTGTIDVSSSGNAFVSAYMLGILPAAQSAIALSAGITSRGALGAAAGAEAGGAMLTGAPVFGAAGVAAAGAVAATNAGAAGAEAMAVAPGLNGAAALSGASAGLAGGAIAQSADIAAGDWLDAIAAIAGDLSLDAGAGPVPWPIQLDEAPEFAANVAPSQLAPHLADTQALAASGAPSRFSPEVAGAQKFTAGVAPSAWMIGLRATANLSASATLIAAVIELTAELALAQNLGGRVEAQACALIDLIAALSANAGAPALAEVVVRESAAGGVEASLRAEAAHGPWPSARALGAASARVALFPAMTAAEILLVGWFAALALEAVLDAELAAEAVALLEESGAISAVAAQAIRATVALTLAAPLSPTLALAAPVASAIVAAAPASAFIVLESPASEALMLESPLAGALIIAGNV